MTNEDASAQAEPPRWRTRWRGPAAEAAFAFSGAALMTLACTNIKVDPLERIGQVSALASMGLRYTLIALALIVALVIAARLRGGVGFDVVARMTCAAIAGIATGMVAGGIVVALRGTPWGLNGHHGDAKALMSWIDSVRNGHEPSPGYPPLPLLVMAWYSDLLDLPSGYTLKHAQIIGTAMLGPALYLSWRLILPPIWALGVGLVAGLPLIDSAPYKPYGNFVLMVSIPVLVWGFEVLRRAHELPRGGIAGRGAVLGLEMGLLCLTYSGWFPWLAPGVLVATLVMFPWRRAPRNVLVLCGTAAAAFAAVAGRYVLEVVTSAGIVDKYIYFDVYADPAYIAMYRGDLPGPVGMWPPLGELGGVGLFTALMAGGLALAIALGRTRTPVIGIGAILAGAWLLRFHYAHYLWTTKLVQLYPRTTPVILYCLLALSGYALHLLLERLRARSPADSPLHTPSARIGALCGLLFLFASTGSAISDHYMPSDRQPISPGLLAWRSHHTPP